MPTETEIATLLVHMRGHLAEAHTIAKAAELCAQEGWSDRALHMTLDIEPLVHDANHLLQAAAAVNRRRRPNGKPSTEG